MAKVYIETYGCTFNQAESKYMEDILIKNKQTIVDTPEESDIIIINSCTVKQGAETKLFKAIRKYKNKPIIVSGCVPQAEPQLVDTKLKDYSVIGPGAINRINEFVEKTLRNERVVDLSNYRPIKLGKVLAKNEAIEMVPINEGCLANCTFCKTKQSRGDLYSYPKEIIIKHVEEALQRGAKELWFTSQDTGAYGADINTNIVELLEEIIKKFKGFYWIRLGMMNPNHAYRLKEKLCVIFKDLHMFKFLHASVQSGSDKVLRDMKRPHTTKHFIEAVKYIRSQIPEITIATDIIVGYPTESEEDFEETLKIVEKASPGMVNISRFWPRPGTEAAKLKPLKFEVIKNRLVKLHEVVSAILEKENEKWLNWSGKVIIDEIGKKNTLKGRNYCYKQIIIPEKDIKKFNLHIGDIVNVEIIDYDKKQLVARVLEVEQRNNKRINDKK